MNFEDDITMCLAILEQGGLILYPTDTIWGIGCDAGNAAAVSKIYQLKKRPDKKTMVILVAEESDILQYVTQPDPRIFDYIKGIAKPTTVIYEGGIGLAANLIQQDGSVAIRVSNDLFCKKLIKKFGRPIVSTSANISGYPPPVVFGDIDVVIKKGVDYVVQHRQDEIAMAQPSAIIKWNADGSFTIIRS